MTKQSGNIYKRALIVLLICLSFASLSSCMESGHDVAKATGLTMVNGEACYLLEDVFGRVVELHSPKMIPCTDPNAAISRSGSQLLCLDDSGQGPFAWMVDEVKMVILGDGSAVEGATQKIYNALATSEAFLEMFYIAVALAIALFSAGIALGVVDSNPYSVMMFVIKLSVIIALITQIDFYQFLVIDTFESFVEDMSTIMNNIFVVNASGLNPTMAYNLFGNIDSTLALLFSPGMWALLFALLVEGAGILYFVLFIFLIIIYFAVVVNTLRTYIIAMLVRSMLYAVGPIFISFGLFSPTRSLLNGWIEQLISFSLQVIFLFALIGMFHIILMDFLFGALYTGNDANGHYAVCYMSIFSFWEALGWWNIRQVDLNAMLSVNAGIPMSLSVLLAGVSICSTMYYMIAWIIDLAARISSGFLPIADASGAAAGMGIAIASRVTGVHLAGRAASASAGYANRKFVSPLMDSAKQKFQNLRDSINRGTPWS